MPFTRLISIMRKEEGRKIFEGTMGDKNKREKVLKHEWFPCNAGMEKLLKMGGLRRVTKKVRTACNILGISRSLTVFACGTLLRHKL